MDEQEIIIAGAISGLTVKWGIGESFTIGIDAAEAIALVITPVVMDILADPNYKRIEHKLDLLLAKKTRAKRTKQAEASPSDGVDGSEDQANWPEWFSLGHGMKGWVIALETAEEWRVKSGFAEEYCLDKVYVVRGWWTDKMERDGRDPYATFQRACRFDWGKSSTPSLHRGDEHGRPGNDSETDTPSELDQQARLQRMANQRGEPVGGVKPDSWDDGLP